MLKPDSQHHYKIAFIGSKEVGKTTLASYLNGELKSLGHSVDLVPEVARYCPLPLNENTSIESAYWLFGAQISAEALVEKTRQFTICDRTVLDVFPFTKYSIGQNEDASVQAELSSLKALIKMYLQSRPYDIFYYVPIVGSGGEQDVQSSNDSLQSEVDREFRLFLKELSKEMHVNIYFIEKRSVQDRIEEVIQHLNSQISAPVSLSAKNFANIEDLRAWIVEAGIDLSKWGSGGNKALKNLWNELLDNEIMLEANPYLRKVEVVQIIVKQGNYYLMEVDQEFGDGYIRSRKQPPSEKMHSDEDYKTAALRCLKEELKLAEEKVTFLPSTYYQVTEITESSSYPGLATEYTFHSIEVEVTGLPEQDFWCDNLAYGDKDIVKRHHWAWVSEKNSMIARIPKKAD